MSKNRGLEGRLRDHLLFGMGLVIEGIKQILFVAHAIGATLRPVPSEFIYVSIALVYVCLRIKRTCKENGKNNGVNNSEAIDRYKGEVVVALDGMVWFLIYIFYLFGFSVVAKIPELMTLNLVFVLGLLGVTKGFKVGDLFDHLFLLIKKAFVKGV